MIYERNMTQLQSPNTRKEDQKLSEIIIIFTKEASLILQPCQVK